MNIKIYNNFKIEDSLCIQHQNFQKLNFESLFTQLIMANRVAVFFFSFSNLVFSKILKRNKIVFPSLEKIAYQVQKCFNASDYTL